MRHVAVEFIRPTKAISKPQFISERITPEKSAFDTSAMSRGEPSLPRSFAWRGQRYDVHRLVGSRRQMGEDRGDRYVRRHYFDIETKDALRMTLYFERNPSDRSRRKAWWIYTLAAPDPVMQTEHLALRRWTYADRDVFFRMVQDPEVMRHLHDFVPMTDEEAGAALQATIERYSTGVGDWAIVQPETGDIMGESGLTAIEVGRDVEIEIGWMLFPRFQGRGYALEAATAVRDYAFATRGIKKLIAFIRPDNKRSQHLAEKLGMQCAGRSLHRGQEMLKYELKA